MQWLINAAEQAGWKAATPPMVAPKASIPEAWAQIAKVYGVTEAQLARAVATMFRLELADLTRIEEKAIKLVPEKVARKFSVLPVRESHNEVIVAAAAPADYDAEQAIQFVAGRRVVFTVASPTELVEAINVRYAPERAIESLLKTVDAETAESVEVVEHEGPELLETSDIASTPVVKLTNMILSSAVTSRASDIHIEPGRNSGVVRFRVDGVLRQFMQLPLPVLNRVVSRIKVLGKLDISDRLRPQDGRTRLAIAGKAFDLRISTVPTREAEKAVLRILNPDASRKLEELGIAQQEYLRFKHILSYREGIVIVTGPTGSGKTTTLYGALRDLSGGSVNIMTVEDPVEYELQGITQIQIEPKRDVTFASALRAILRQDPDIVFVGEIRDPETAQVALQASMTGHLVLATLHTNDAIGVVQRLVDLGLDRASISASLRGALGQRLIRKLCDNCAAPQPADRDENTARLEKLFGTRQVRRPVGCKVCGDSGYFGRIPLIEVLVSNTELQEKIARGSTTAEMQRTAERGGMRALREVSLEYVVSGATTLQEVERVLGEGEGSYSSNAVPEVETQRVLVVDDDPLMRELAVNILRDNGFETEQAIDGQAAIDFLMRDANFSLVTLDLSMPNADGRDVLRHMRSSVPTATLPAIVLTGSDSEASEVELMNEGADDYLHKPLDPARFIARVRAVLRRAGA